MFKKIKNYFQEELWNFSLAEKHGKSHFAYKFLRIAYLSLKSFFLESKGWASSLTYLTLMSIVPLIALGSIVVQLLGLHGKFRDQLLIRFPEQTVIFTELFKYADAAIDQTKEGVIAVIGMGLFFLSVLFALRTLEKVLNHMWGLKKNRAWWKVFSFYFLFLLIFPVFFIISNSTFVYLVGFLNNWISSLPLDPRVISAITFFIQFISYLFFWIVFTAAYIILPNTKIAFKSAALGGFWAALFYTIAQWGYITFQIGVSRYGSIYGTVAAFPLFLVWIQVSWYLILLGAEIAHAHQTFYEYEFERRIDNISIRTKLTLALWVAQLAVKRGALTVAMLEEEFRMPRRLGKIILKQLEECHIVKYEEDLYKIYPGIGSLKISEVIKKLDSKGDNDFNLIPTPSLAKFYEALASFEKAIETIPENVKIENVPDSI